MNCFQNYFIMSKQSMNGCAGTYLNFSTQFLILRKPMMLKFMLDIVTATFRQNFGSFDQINVLQRKDPGIESGSMARLGPQNSETALQILSILWESPFYTILPPGRWWAWPPWLGSWRPAGQCSPPRIFSPWSTPPDTSVIYLFKNIFKKIKMFSTSWWV